MESKELRKAFSLALAMLLVGVVFVSGVSGWLMGGEKIVKGSSLEVAVLGGSAEIRQALARFVGTGNVYAPVDVNSKVFDQADIVFVNSSYLRNLLDTEDGQVVASRLSELAVSGKPVITVGSHPDILYEYVRPKLMVTDLNWGQQKIIALGIRMFPDNTSVTKFVSGELSVGVGEMFEWASEIKGRPVTGDVSVQSASWSWIGDVEWTSSDSYYPHGRFNGILSTYKLTEDGSNSYNWYSHKVQPQTRPGFDIYSSDWRNDYIWTNIWTKINADYYQDNDVIDYDPGETSGTNTVSVSIGVVAGEQGAAVTASQTWSYSIPDVAVHDHSDFSTDIAHWEHEITNENSGSAKNTYTGKPGAVVRTAQSNQYYKVYTRHDVRYRDPGFIWDDVWTAPWINFGIQVTQ